MPKESDILSELDLLVNELEHRGQYSEASVLHDVFIRIAAKRRRYRLYPWTYTIPFALGAGALGVNQMTAPESSHIVPSDSVVHSAPIKTDKSLVPHESSHPAHPANFNDFKKFTLKSEGGYSNRKRKADPGGPTNFGITQKTYDQFRDMHKLPHKSVKGLTVDEAKVILRDLYWRKVSANYLPEKTAVAVADMGVLQGPGTAIKALQRVLGLHDDGLWGDTTARAVWDFAKTPELDAKLAMMVTAERERQLHTLPNAKYNPGWFNRMRDMEAYIQSPSSQEVAVTPSTEKDITVE